MKMKKITFLAMAALALTACDSATTTGGGSTPDAETNQVELNATTLTGMWVTTETTGDSVKVERSYQLNADGTFFHSETTTMGDVTAQASLTGTWVLRDSVLNMSYILSSIHVTVNGKPDDEKMTQMHDALQDYNKQGMDHRQRNEPFGPKVVSLTPDELVTTFDDQSQVWKRSGKE